MRKNGIELIVHHITKKDTSLLWHVCYSIHCVKYTLYQGLFHTKFPYVTG